MIYVVAAYLCVMAFFALLLAPRIWVPLLTLAILGGTGTVLMSWPGLVLLTVLAVAVWWRRPSTVVVVVTRPGDGGEA